MWSLNGNAAAHPSAMKNCITFEYNSSLNVTSMALAAASTVYLNGSLENLIGQPSLFNLGSLCANSLKGLIHT